MVPCIAVTCPPGASPDGVSGVCGGTGRCRMCLAAIARQRGRRAARAPCATSRSRAKGGVSWTAIALRRAVTAPARRSVGRAEGNRPWREVSCVAEERSEVVSRCGAAHDGRRAEWLAGQMSPGHAAAAACDGKGTRVEGLIPQFVAGSERPAWRGTDRPSQLSSLTTLSPAAWRGRGARRSPISRTHTT